MISKKLMQYAEEKGLNIAGKGMNAVVYGVIDGFMTTMSEGEGAMVVAFSGAVTDEAAAKIEEKFSQKDFRKQYKIAQYNIERESVTIAVNNGMSTMKKSEGGYGVFSFIFE